MNTKSGPPSEVPPRNGAPRHFHLLWDTELEELRTVLLSIQKHRDAVLEHWYRLYLLHFADHRALTRTEFMEIFGSELDSTLQDLIDCDIDRFTSDVRRIGEILAEREVPFS